MIGGFYGVFDLWLKTIFAAIIGWNLGRLLTLLENIEQLLSDLNDLQ